MQTTTATPTIAPERLLTASDVSHRLNMAKTGVYALLSRGDLAHIRIGRLVRVREDDLVLYLAMHRVAADSPDRSSHYGLYPPA